MTRYSSLHPIKAKVASSYGVFRPDSNHFPILFCNDEKCLNCLISLCGSFFLSGIEIPENHFYWKIFEPGEYVIKQQASAGLQGQLLIISMDPASLPQEILRIPEILSALNMEAVKILINLRAETNGSAAGSLIDRLIADAFIYSVGSGSKNGKNVLPYDQTRLVQESMMGLSARNEKISRIPKARRVWICKQVYHRTPGRLKRELLLEQSLEALIHTSKPLDSLALEAGYRSRENFITVFCRQFGISPGKLRARTRNLSSNFFS